MYDIHITELLLSPANEAAGRYCFYMNLSVYKGEGSTPKGSSSRGVCFQGCLHLRGSASRGIFFSGSLHPGVCGKPPREPEKRAVRILVECFLVCCRYFITLYQGSLMITLSITYSQFNTNSRNKLAIGDNYGVNFLYYFQ